MGITESDAQAYLDTAISELLGDEELKNTELSNSLRKIQESSFAINNEIEEIPCSKGKRVLAVLASFIAEFR